ncbi:MAG: cyclic nucleotide-binding domain-containing protein [Betaproteobacteria bacterium]|nr:MAG: cyclic nucleotide-binding domain-containing protein [Betaproteobacteria bacterium]
MRIGPRIGEFWGGLGAMLVAVPSSIAFGVAVFAPLGDAYAAQGALAGILGATVLGLIAPALGGTPRLISAPCAPAAAVLSALALEAAARGVPAGSVLLQLTLVCLAAGALQLAFGLAGIGRLIRYMPYPVVSGYLTGVGLIIILSQVPKFLGAPSGVPLADALAAPSLWHGIAIAVGAATLTVMLLAPRLTQLVPAAILGLGAGIIAYLGFAIADPALRVLAQNPLLVGELDVTPGRFLAALAERWQGFGGLDADDLVQILVPGATLAILLSIDTLKTCVVLDALTRSRHDSNRELFGQGVANLAAAAAGGMPGAGTMGATLVNLTSGGQTRASALIEGALVLVVLLALSPMVGGLPIAALAGILILVGARMIDWRSFAFLRNRSTVLDFAVIAAVVVVAVGYSLVVAAAVGVALAILLFIREQIGSSVVHRRSSGGELFSKQVRLPDEMKRLQARGGETAILELQGSLFFGTADRLYNALEPELKTRRFIILDLQRVQSVDITAAHLLEQIEDRLAERQGSLLFSDLPRNLPSGRDIQRYFGEVGLARSGRRALVFDELDGALEWVEDRILEEEHVLRAEEKPLELSEMDLFAGRKPDTLAALQACLEQRACKAGERIFGVGDAGDELYLIRRGSVRIVLPLGGGEAHHLATFGRGDFFGEMAFLDRDPRSADAIAFSDTDLYALSRVRFDAVAAEHRRLAAQLLGGLARVLAIRLRYANAELRALRSPGSA